MVEAVSTTLHGAHESRLAAHIGNLLRQALAWSEMPLATAPKTT